ncbi:AMP-binding protein [Plantactinospora sp. KLBMP9567]|uniref:AMP-binding protein n=1 Tax=Plantactinospora sp. KLBMP9567 TaxID=3085900 RepID=UPI0029819793|nr:AMP-binding protein [Plantactinospora sp. KLBMP9567]MDW5328886.1 AMP-binding protein [Plantactinospora sp. KLBMP9567]
MVITVIESVRRLARVDPGRIAVATPLRTIDYAQLYRAAAAHAGTLKSADGSVGAIAVVCEAGDGGIPLMLGAMIAGRPVVLLPSTATPATRAAAQRQTGFALVAWPGAGPEQARIERAEVDPDVPTPAASLVFCTSGSTGNPKLVPLRENAVARFAAWAAERFRIGAGSRVLSYAPLNFDLSLLEVWTTLAYGGTVVAATGPALRDSRHLAALVRTWEPDLVEGVPVLYERLARGLAESGDLDALPSGHVIMTGDNTPLPTRRVIRQMFPAASYYNIYGSTETNDSLIAQLDYDEVVAERIPLGEPLPGVDVRLIDGGGTELRGPGSGELVVTTPFQAEGYLGTSGGGNFVRASPGWPGDTYFRTGDMVERRPDGALQFLGRRDFRIKVNGVSVDLEDVEDVISVLDGVTEAVTAPWTAPSGETRVAALIRTAPEQTLSAVQVRKFCAKRVESAAVPFRISFVTDPLPRTSTGKVDRNMAARLLNDPAAGRVGRRLDG